MKNYKMKVTIVLTVEDIEAKNMTEASAIVYDMFKNNPDGIVEYIESEVMDEEDMDDEEEDDE